MTRFETEHPSGKAAWRRVYEVFHARPYGDVVGYGEVLRLTDVDLRANRAAIYRAQAEMEAEDSRSIEAVPNVGYRIIQPTEHAASAHRRRRSAGRQMRRAVSVARATNVALVDNHEANRLAAFVNWGVAIENAIMSSHKRHDLTEQRLESIERGAAGRGKGQHPTS